MDVPLDEILKIIASFFAGSLLGLEREYRSKPAGLRTIIMITVGSTLFSILSVLISQISPDRIASNIVTGVGFVGAGVIFKEGVSLKGITTAASIWAAAAIGMAIGFGEYWLALVTLGVVLFTLIILPGVEERLDSHNLFKYYKITFNIHEYSLSKLDDEFNQLQLKCAQTHISKNANELTVTLTIKTDKRKHQEITQLLILNPAIIQIEV